MCMRQVACERPYGTRAAQARAGAWPLSDVAQQDEAASRTSHDVRRPVRKKRGGRGKRTAAWQAPRSKPISRGQKHDGAGMRCSSINSPCALEAVDAEEVDAELDGALCMSDGGCARCHHVSICHTHPHTERGHPAQVGGQKGADLLHLCSTIHPASFSFLMTGPGLLPAVSTMLMPSSMMAWA